MQPVLQQCWRTHATYWTRYWKWETEWLYDYRGLKCIGCCPSRSCGWVGGAAHCPAQHYERILGQMYCIHVQAGSTVSAECVSVLHHEKVKNNCKLGTICMALDRVFSLNLLMIKDVKEMTLSRGQGSWWEPRFFLPPLESLSWSIKQATQHFSHRVCLQGWFACVSPRWRLRKSKICYFSIHKISCQQEERAALLSRML